MLDPQRVQSIFDAVISSPTAKREHQLAELCANDVQLEAEVRSLVKCHSMLGSFLDRPISNSEVAPHQGLQPGDKIGVFELKKLIGEGAFGQVYIGHQHEPVSRDVAVKLLRPGLTSEEVLARFMAEQQVLAMLDHPHIAKVLDVGGQTGNQAYFVMELVDGIPISEYCDHFQLSIEKRLELFATVSEAVQHAHHKGVIHRDLKPSNILVSHQDGKHFPKIIDFGIAKALDRPFAEALYETRGKQVMGTPLYMSPEQALTKNDVDTRSDVYSLGVVLYELLTGTTPITPERFQGSSFNELCEIVASESAIKPSSRLAATTDTIAELASLRDTSPNRLSSSIRGDLDWIVMRALEKEPRRRYQNPNEFAADLNRFLNHEAVHARPPSRIYAVRKMIRKNLAACLAGLLIFVSLTASSIFSYRQAAIAEKARGEASTAKQVELEKRLNAEVVQELLLDSFRRPHPSVSGMDVRVTDVLSQAVDSIEKNDRLPIASKIELLYTIAVTLENLDLQEETARVTKLLTPLALEHLGPNADVTIESRIGRGWASVRLGKHDDAIYEVEALERIQNLSRENRVRTLELKLRANWNKGNWQAARECEQAILSMNRKQPVSNDSALAVAYESQHRIPELIVIREREYEKARTNYGPGGVPTVFVALQLADAYKQDINHAKDAVELLRKVKSEAKPVLGDRHPYLLRLNRSLSRCLLAVDPEEATNLARENVRRSEELLGTSNQQTLGSELHLARCLNHTNRDEEAVEVCDRAIEKSTIAFGKNHLQTLQLEEMRCMTAGMRDVRQFGKISPETFADTEALYEKCLAIGPKTAIAQRVTMLLSQAYHKAVDDVKSEIEVLEKLLFQYEENPRFSNPNLHLPNLLLASAYARGLRVSDSTSQFECSLKSLYNNQDPRLPNAFVAFSKVLVKAREYNLAYQYSIRGMGLCKPGSTALAELKFNAGTSMAGIALSLEGQEQKQKLQRAADYFEELYSSLPENNPKMPYSLGKRALCAARLAKLYERLELTENAERWSQTNQELEEVLADPVVAARVKSASRLWIGM